MPWYSALAIYLLFWVFTLFLVLPHGVRTSRELGEPATLSTAADDAGACCGCGCRSGQG